MSVIGAAGITTDDQTNAESRRAAGEFVRGVSSARNWITNPADDPDNDDHPFPVESGRYHLYVALNCPWCHRVAMTRSLLGLEDAISMDVLFPGRTGDDDKVRGPNLWRFAPEGVTGRNGRHVSFPECGVDTASGTNVTYVKEIYEQSGIMDQRSVPILYDKKNKVVVNNESAEIMRMFGTVCLPLSSLDREKLPTLYPHPRESNSDLASKIDEANEWIYTDINNGAYKAGFSSNQDVYEKAFRTYFAALDRLNNLLKQSDNGNGFICTAATEGPTESDVRALCTLWRHDAVYHNRMKLNQSYLYDYPFIWSWMKRMLVLPGLDRMTHKGILAHSRQGYFGRTGNGVVPLGPKLNEDIIPDAPK